MNKYLLLFSIIVLFIACRHQVDREKVRTEIFQTEKAFEKMASEKGLAEAFWYFAAEDAVIKREKDTLISGKESIRNYFQSRKNQNVKLTWTPDFIGVSDCGTLGYTYGKYIFRVKPDEGDTVQSKGVFHTVWKKQDDGTWKYVWD